MPVDDNWLLGNVLFDMCCDVLAEELVCQQEALWYGSNLSVEGKPIAGLEQWSKLWLWKPVIDHAGNV